MQFIETQMHDEIPQMNDRTPHKQSTVKTQAFQQQTEHKILKQIRQRARQVRQVM